MSQRGVLTGGFTTEYSGMQFALLFLAEYANSVAVGLLGSSLFLGGYHTGLGDAFGNLIWPLLPGVLVSKAAIMFLVLVYCASRTSRTTPTCATESTPAMVVLPKLREGQ